MSFVQRELDRISKALREQPTAKNYDELYAAQQALSWALDPEGAKRPMAFLRGIQEGSEGCSVDHRPPSS